jgi:hypothetical protein
MYAKAVTTPSNAPLEQKRELIIDLDGFFRHAAETQASTMKDVFDAIPDTLDGVRKVLVLHSLLRSSLVLAGSGDPVAEKELQNDWSERAMLQAIVEVHRGSVTNSPEWLTFYAEDLREEFAQEFEDVEDAIVQLTLDNRLIAWTKPKEKKIQLSAITREYLLRMNVFLVNASDWKSEEGVAVDEDLAELSLQYFMSYIARLHRRTNPSTVPVVRPNSRENFHTAQIITQIQIEFLLAHEFGHLILKFRDAESITSQEFACDSFAFERISATESDVSRWFMAVRWLFDMLALDRVVGEILAFEEGEWQEDIDWLQSELRERQRHVEIITKYHGTETPALSRVEEVGTLFLLDAKWRLNRLGPEVAQSIINAVVEAAPELSVEEFRIVAEDIMLRQTAKQ